jgi:hypothetical protein
VSDITAGQQWLSSSKDFCAAIGWCAITPSCQASLKPGSESISALGGYAGPKDSNVSSPRDSHDAQEFILTQGNFIVSFIEGPPRRLPPESLLIARWQATALVPRSRSP